MSFWWTTLHSAHSARQAVHSRPRVAQAAEAARHAVDIAPVSLGSARIDSESQASLRHFDAMERAAISGPLHKARRRARRGLETELIWATARAAQETGRQPEEVWAEALRDWLANREPGTILRPPSFEVRRQQVWRDIELTLAGLRAS
ncbi:MAG: hypothetical protein ACLQUY_12875 [Ktedonobacterales bacterium]